jgi:cyclopropane fatty-acyl-phospholipid synthase-like methyltransferase
MYRLPYSEACERNKQPILEVLQTVFPKQGNVLELGSCSGQHIVHFAPAFPGLTWQPSDQSEYLPGLAARIRQEGTAAILDPIELDVTAAWPDAFYDAVFSANTAHIMDWPAVEAMFSGVGRVLVPGGVFCLYGPFGEKDGSMVTTNEDFDRSLRARDPAMGIRSLDSIEKLACRSHLKLVDGKHMPANNQILIFSTLEVDPDD